MKQGLSLYIHIPFCYSRCYYCDFNSSIEDNNVEKYIKYLKKEIDIYSEKFKDYKLKTIFFGGGTPSFIDEKYIEEILLYIYSVIDVSQLEEVTLEANPNTVNLRKINTYKKAGVNRISLGVQTLNNKLLKKIGRSHSKEDFYKAYEILRSVGITNINADIMFNLPGQSKVDLKDTLEKVSQLDIPHISFYSLGIEEGTPFYEMQQRGEISLSSEDIEREMYHESIEYLKTQGYHQYEVSNLSKENYESIHNLAYWKLENYIGLGLSAHSNIDQYRYGNVSSFKEYFELIDLKKLPIDNQSREYIDRDMEIAEYIMLGLRLNRGIDRNIFKEKYGVDLDYAFKGKLNKFKKDGLIYEEQSSIKLTDKGFDICNLIFVEILPDK